MKKIFAGIGIVLLTILKAVVWLLLGALKLGLELVKIILLLFGLVLRVFLIFFKAGTP